LFNGYISSDPTCSGLGISIGDDGKGCCGSILIRSISELGKDCQVIEGPSLVVDCVLEKNEVLSIEDLVKEKLKNEISIVKSKDVLFMTVNDKLPVLQVIQSNRFGLTLKKDVMNRSQYVCRLYRFFTLPQQMKKGKPHMIVSQHHLGKSEEEIIKLLGVSKHIVKEYASLYEKGKKHKNVKQFFGINLSSKQVCELFGTLS
jgi:hypothetical protein